ncbi:MAG: hypothetical protein WBD21_08425, partial [Candidatus Acidiferrales bacterium]
AEHSFLLVIVSAHSLVSLNLFTSDEFFQLKLHKKRVFQQAAKESSERADNSCGRIQFVRLGGSSDPFIVALQGPSLS